MKAWNKANPEKIKGFKAAFEGRMTLLLTPDHDVRHELGAFLKRNNCTSAKELDPRAGCRIFKVA